jgi:hypothetical protein
MDSLLGTTDTMKSIVDSVTWLYVVSNSLRVFFYAPQIRAVWKATDGAVALSITTWAFWTFAHTTAMLYGWLVIHDQAFAAIFMGNMAGAGAVTLIAISKRLNRRTSRDANRADRMSLA